MNDDLTQPNVHPYVESETTSTDIGARITELQSCRCVARYSIEPHGDGYAVYWGRCNHKHGANIAWITGCGREDIIKFFESQLNRRGE